MRYKRSKASSKALFRATTGNTRAINIFPMVMRGGYRL